MSKLYCKIVTWAVMCCVIGITANAFGGKVFRSYTTEDGWEWQYTTTDPEDANIFREKYIDGIHYYGGSATIVDYRGTGGDVAMPSVVTYKDGSYDCVAVVRSVKGPDRSQSLAGFSNYQQYVTKLTIPDTVKSIGRTAFWRGKVLEEVVFSKNLEELGYQAFEDCPKLKSVKLTGGKLHAIGYEAFDTCTNLEEVVIDGDGTLQIPSRCFEDCTALKSVKFGSGVKTIGGDYAPFTGCVALEEFDFGGVETIIKFGSDAGMNASKPLHLDLTKTCITNINGFGGAGLSSVRFADGITIGKNAFYGCTKLEAVTNTPSAYGLYSGCTNLKEVVLASDVRELYGYMFSGCANLQKIDSAKARALIGECNVAEYCKGGYAILPPLTNFCMSSLRNCDKLRRVIFAGDAPTYHIHNTTSSTHEHALLSDCTVLVQRGSKGWNGEESEDLPTAWPYDATGNQYRWPIQYMEIEVGFDTDSDGNADEVRYYTPNQPFVSFPVPTRSGYKFRGWFTDPVQGSRIPEGEIVQPGMTLCAHWLVGETFANPVVISFQPNGGETYPESVTYEAGEALDYLPVPTCWGKTFMGWFTDPDGGEVVNLNECAPVKDMTLYAHWAQGVWSYEVSNGSAKLYGGEQRAAVNAFMPEMTTPTHIDGYPVVDIGDWAYFGCTSLCSIVVSEGVTNIGAYAFVIGYCITNAVLPKSLMKIGDYAFCTSSQLAALDFDYRIGEIGEYAFGDSFMITNVVVSTNTIVRDNAFCENCVIHRAEEESEILTDVLPNGKELFVPRDWIEGERLRSLYKDGDTAASVLKKTTGKHDGNGKALCVWHDYVAGTDPTNENSVFSTSIEMIGGLPRVTWKPDLESKRLYKIWGSTNLADGAGWEWPTNSLHRFFKVTVEMP